MMLHPTNQYVVIINIISAIVVVLTQQELDSSLSLVLRNVTFVFALP